MPSLSDPKPNKLLLMRGRFLESFMIEVKAAYNSPGHLSKGGALLAVYGSNRFPGTQHHIAAMDQKGAGACTFNAFGPDVVRLVRVDSDDIYQALKNG
jgi:hypothetical protein